VTPAAAHYDVYGFRFSVLTDAPTDAVAGLDNDFAHFRSPDAGHAGQTVITLRLSPQDPPYDEVPARAAAVYTPRNVSFTDGPRTYIDYSGHSLAIYDRSLSSFRIYSRNHDVLYEASYLFLLSQIGEFLDGRRLHRIHAMALSYHGRAVLAILPMGGGKSTLVAELLKDPCYDFLSDDSPFIDSDGSLRAFPLRLGFLPGGEAAIPADQLRTVNRMEFGPKLLANYSYFAHRVTPRAEPGIVFLGYRSLARECRIEPAGTVESYRSMIADCAVGLGLFQGLEFVVRSSPSELAGKAWVGASRLRNARRLFGRSKVYRLILGRDRAENAHAVTELVKRELPDAGLAGGVRTP
jgi:hypothetical protein